MQEVIAELIGRYPGLADCSESIRQAVNAIVCCYENGGTVYCCGNGGSAADAEHIVGELMKGFLLSRPLPESDVESLLDIAGEEDGAYLAKHLQCGLPALSLMAQQALTTAVGNDLGGDLAPAQQLYGLGKAGDVLIGISTSGNARNIALACKVARLKKMKIIGLTGKKGGLLGKLADVPIHVPEDETFKIQEYHLPVYHAICIAVEKHFFKK